MLVNAGFMRKSVATDNSLIGLYFESNNAGQKLTRGEQLISDDRSFIWQPVGSNMQRHNNFFKRCITRTLADTIDRALNLACACFYCRQAICYSKSQVIVTMNADDKLTILHHSLCNSIDQSRVF